MVLTFHVVPGRIMASQLQNGQTLTTVEGMQLTLTIANLVVPLRAGNLTVFAPTNAAFAAIPGGAPTDVSVLTQVLQLHVVGTRALSTDLTNGQLLPTLLTGRSLLP